MRNIILSLIFIGFAGYAAKILYDNFNYSENGFLEKTYAYPDKITVINKEGSKIQITLLGRNSRYLKFQKKESNTFVYPINSLSEKSQALVMKYPESGIDDVSSYLSSSDIELKDAYIIQLEEEIRKLNKEIESLEARANAATSKTERRTIERKIEALIKEVSELESKIAKRWQ